MGAEQNWSTCSPDDGELEAEHRDELAQARAHELGHPGQADVVAGWFAEAGLCEIDILNDLAGRPRVVSARKKTAT